MKKFLSFVLCLVMLFSFVACGQENKEDTEYHLTASKLIDEYEDSSFNTDSKYNDKILYITGKIEEIEDLDERIIVVFGNDKQDGTFVLVYCSFYSDNMENKLLI